MSRTRPYAEAADRHDPDSGLYWYVIAEDDLDVGTVWIELLPAGSEAVLGVFLGDAAYFGRGIGTAAIELAIAEFRRAHPHCPSCSGCVARTPAPSPATGASASPSRAAAPSRCHRARSCPTTVWSACRADGTVGDAL